MAGVHLVTGADGADGFDQTDTGNLLAIHTNCEMSDAVTGSQCYTGHESGTLATVNTDGTNTNFQVAASVGTGTSIHIGGMFAIVPPGLSNKGAIEPLGSRNTFVIDMELTANSSTANRHVSGIRVADGTCNAAPNGCNIYVARSLLRDSNNSASSSRGHGYYESLGSTDYAEVEFYSTSIIGNNTGMTILGQASTSANVALSMSGVLIANNSTRGLNIGAFRAVAGNEITGAWTQCATDFSNTWQYDGSNFATAALFNAGMTSAQQALLDPCIDADSVESAALLSAGGYGCKAGSGCDGTFSGSWRFAPGDSDANFKCLPRTLTQDKRRICSFSGRGGGDLGLNRGAR